MQMLLRPNPSSGVPIYLQLVEQVKHAIRTRALQGGDLLPGVRPLAEEFVISPNAVAKAYRELEHEGVIDLRGADGAQVASTFVERFCGENDRRLVRGAYGPDLMLAELARENSRLTAEIAAEVAERVKRNRELEIAREVQQRLFPQEHHHIAGLDYAGACRPALGVGGDYYDFIPVSETELGIAIGDVSGKGTPAALLMATLRAYLRGQPLHHDTDLAEVTAHLNRLVYDSSSASRYATFFYAHYDSSTRLLRYVNAGHNPPFIVKARGGHEEIVRLAPTGSVIGLILDCSYVQERIVLEPGDCLVAFTDGITESMNAVDEEWGEERLAQVIGANRALPARELVDFILRRANDFVAGAPQHDDMTCVTVRIG
jgi:sigma-B regulation protein RsbU (phosphoserine phosphatase)